MRIITIIAARERDQDKPRAFRSLFFTSSFAGLAESTYRTRFVRALQI